MVHLTSARNKAPCLCNFLPAVQDFLPKLCDIVPQIYLKVLQSISQLAHSIWKASEHFAMEGFKHLQTIFGLFGFNLGSSASFGASGVFFAPF
jgi:hypothetical protein